MKSVFYLAVLSAGLCPILMGQSSANVPSILQSNLPQQPLGPGDLVSLTVYASPELSRSFRIKSDGSLRLPLLKQSIRAANIMPEELGEAIDAALRAEQVMVQPVVTITVVEYGSRPVSVTGAVRRPLTFQAYGEVTLLNALARAEGLSPEAGPDVLVSLPHSNSDGTSSRSVERISITRLMNGSDAKLNLKLQGGEEIRIPEAEKVYVVGNVKKPGAFPVQDSSNTSVLKILAVSEGVLPFAAKQAYIYRQEPGSETRKEIPVELTRIVRRETADIPLQGGDIFYIPDNRGRRLAVTTLERIAGFGTNTASGVLIWRR
jgi:polysaccharide export outer membrane protein